MVIAGDRDLPEGREVHAWISLLVIRLKILDDTGVIKGRNFSQFLLKMF